MGRSNAFRVLEPLSWFTAPRLPALLHPQVRKEMVCNLGRLFFMDLSELMKKRHAYVNIGVRPQREVLAQTCHFPASPVYRHADET